MQTDLNSKNKVDTYLKIYDEKLKQKNETEKIIDQTLERVKIRIEQVNKVVTEIQNKHGIDLGGVIDINILTSVDKHSAEFKPTLAKLLNSLTILNNKKLDIEKVLTEKIELELGIKNKPEIVTEQVAVTNTNSINVIQPVDIKTESSVLTAFDIGEGLFNM